MIGELAGTVMTMVSANRRAIGVAFFSVTGGLLVSIAPTITAPTTISALGLPLSVLTNWVSAMVPPAPPLLSYEAVLAWPAAISAAPSERPVWS
ncbi:hypothetical protein D3C80_1954590 [compost metagenome]